MRHLVIFTLIFSTQLYVFAGWNEDFEVLKTRPRSYEDSGAICEELAKIQFEKKYDTSKYNVEVGIAYGDTDRTIGELDIVVFEKSPLKVVHVAEVKCWKDARAGLEKAKDQRKRFLTNVNRDKVLYFESTSTQKDYSQQLFEGPMTFSTIGQKGTVQHGYDDELEYDLRALHEYRMDMLECQDRGECAE